MKKLTPSQLRTIKKNLINTFDQATNEELREGKKWYEKANHFCLEMSTKYNVSPFTVASIVSALSPRNKWYKNLIDTETVLSAVQNGLDPEEVKVSTFHTNKYKAFAIARGTKVITEDSQKTYNFVRNVGLLDPNAVTVDVWHLRACKGKKIKSQSIGKIAYNQIKDLTLKLADNVGMTGFEYQAVVWVVAQRIL